MNDKELMKMVYDNNGINSDNLSANEVMNRSGKGAQVKRNYVAAIAAAALMLTVGVGGYFALASGGNKDITAADISSTGVISQSSGSNSLSAVTTSTPDVTSVTDLPNDDFGIEIIPQEGENPIVLNKDISTEYKDPENTEVFVDKIVIIDHFTQVVLSDDLNSKTKEIVEKWYNAHKEEIENNSNKQVVSPAALGLTQGEPPYTGLSRELDPRGENYGDPVSITIGTKVDDVNVFFRCDIGVNNSSKNDYSFIAYAQNKNGTISVVGTFTEDKDEDAAVMALLQGLYSKALDEQREKSDNVSADSNVNTVEATESNDLND